MKRSAANSRTCGSERSPAVGTFAVKFLTGSCWTQKIFDRTFKGLSIDVHGH